MATSPTAILKISSGYCRAFDQNGNLSVKKYIVLGAGGILPRTTIKGGSMKRIKVIETNVYLVEVWEDESDDREAEEVAEEWYYGGKHEDDSSEVAHNPEVRDNRIKSAVLSTNQGGIEFFEVTEDES